MIEPILCKKVTMPDGTVGMVTAIIPADPESGLPVRVLVSCLSGEVGWDWLCQNATVEE